MTTLMKRGLRTTLITATLATFALSSMSASMSASAAPVFDTYIGGVANYAGADVIGDPAEFDIASMQATRYGSLLHVEIKTNFAGQSGQFKPYTKNGKGIGYGDLFLANDWQPFGVGQEYKQDTATTGTHWRYGFSINDNITEFDRYHDKGGSGYLYALNGANNDVDDYISDDFLQNAIWRNNQVVAVDRDSPSSQRLGAGVWTVDTANKTVSFDFDLRGTTLLNDNTLALHWDMLCANDVIEGVVKVDVPAPETAPLMLAGALALVLARRRRGGLTSTG